MLNSVEFLRRALFPIAKVTAIVGIGIICVGCPLEEPRPLLLDLEFLSPLTAFSLGGDVYTAQQATGCRPRATPRIRDVTHDFVLLEDLSGPFLTAEPEHRRFPWAPQDVNDIRLSPRGDRLGSPDTINVLRVDAILALHLRTHAGRSGRTSGARRMRGDPHLGIPTMVNAIPERSRTRFRDHPNTLRSEATLAS